MFWFCSLLISWLEEVNMVQITDMIHFALLFTGNWTKGLKLNMTESGCECMWHNLPVRAAEK